MSSTELPKWVKLQEKTMIRWLNTKLSIAQINPHLPPLPQLSQITNLHLDLQSGLVLIQVTNQIVYETSGKFYATPLYVKPNFKIQKLENLIDFLKFIDLILKINIGNLISAQDIYDNNLKLVLGFIWSLFLFSVNNIESSFVKVKQVLLNWLSDMDLEIDNFNVNWSIDSGNLLLIFNTIFSYYNLDVEFDNIHEILVYLHDDLELPFLIDFDDFNQAFPDEKCIVPFVIELFKYFELNDDVSKEEKEQDELETKKTGLKMDKVLAEEKCCGSDILQSNSALYDLTTEVEPNLKKESEHDPSSSIANYSAATSESQEIDCDTSGITLTSFTPKSTDFSTETLIQSNPYSIDSTFSEESISFEKLDDLVELILLSYKLKHDYETHALNFFDKINAAVFQLTNLLVIEDSTSQLNLIVSSLKTSNLGNFLSKFNTIVNQLDEVIEMLSVYENYTLREKPQLFYSDFSSLTDYYNGIESNLNQIDLKYIPSLEVLSFDNIRKKISTLIDLDYEIIDHLKPFIENLQSIDLGKILEVLELATTKFKDNEDEKLKVMKFLDDFDRIFEIISRLERFYEVLSINIQPEDIHQLDEQISRKEIPQLFNLNSETFEQFKSTVLKDNNQLSHFELIRALKSSNFSNLKIRDFIDIIPTKDVDIITSNDLDFELNSSSTCTSSISSTNSHVLFDENASQISPSNVYDWESLINRLENGFSI